MLNVDLSVIIPTYNRKDMLKECLDSLFNQTYPEDKYEIIVVDDGSTDGTEDLVKNLQKSYSNLVYLKQQNQGPAAARNLGAQHAKADIFVFTDSDCVMPPDFLNNVVSCFKRNPEISACVGYEVSVFKNKPFEGLSEYFKLQYKKKKREEKVFYTFTPIALLNSNRCAIKKDIFLDIGGFDTRFKWSAGEDVDLGYRLLKRSYKICFTDNFFIYHSQGSIVKEEILRWYRFGSWSSVIVKDYFKHHLVIDLPFKKFVILSNFPVTFYLHVNSTKMIAFLLICSFFYPKVGIVLLGLYFLRRCVLIWKRVEKKRDSIKIFFLYHFLRFIREISFLAGNVVGSIKNKIFYI